MDATDAENQGAPLSSIAFENFPYHGTAVSMRSVTFGPATNEVALLITVDPQEGTLRVVLGNGPLNDEAPQGVIELMAMVTELLQDPEFVEGWAAKMEELRQQDAVVTDTEPISFEDLVGDYDELGGEIGPDDVRDGRTF